jgi:hypothetical protein
MFLLNSSNSSLQPTSFQPIFYPSEVAGLTRASSTPDFATDPIFLDCKNITEKMLRTRQFWQHGIEVSVESLKKVPRVDPIEIGSQEKSSSKNENDEQHDSLEPTEINLDSTTD